MSYCGCLVSVCCEDFFATKIGCGMVSATIGASRWSVGRFLTGHGVVVSAGFHTIGDDVTGEVGVSTHLAIEALPGFVRIFLVDFDLDY